MPPESPPAAAGMICLHLPATSLSVRGLLENLFATLPGDLLDADARISTEIVLAEALNNIIEHAYGNAGGTIGLTLRPGEGFIECVITDYGAPLPADGLAIDAPPALKPPATDSSTAPQPAATWPGDHRSPDSQPPLSLYDLPEGGFGWLLIRSLAESIDYCRAEGRNQLRLRLRTGPPPA